MPLYDYKCEKCGHECEERVQRMEEPVPCPNEDCQSQIMERQFSLGQCNFKKGPSGSVRLG